MSSYCGVWNRIICPFICHGSPQWTMDCLRPALASNLSIAGGLNGALSWYEPHNTAGALCALDMPGVKPLATKATPFANRARLIAAALKKRMYHSTSKVRPLRARNHGAGNALAQRCGRLSRALLVTGQPGVMSRSQLHFVTKVARSRLVLLTHLPHYKTAGDTVRDVWLNANRFVVRQIVSKFAIA